MFKKFKDKLAEEVKSSPQRLQQFAQAAQAAVTSASSSISDITNNDLFSIGENDASSKSQVAQNQPNFHNIALPKSENMQNTDTMEYQLKSEENQRQRRLSNSSFASDISFRLPSYESPAMYHLQSDMDVSASEAEEKGSFGGMVNLDRVTKEQLYSAYRRTQDRCTKYKTQYSDLARHYKLLERENAKARNVLVETQDKALRRISELREQCSLEQSAKAHLEKALRIEIEERNIKIDTLNTKLNILQTNDVPENKEVKEDSRIENNKNDAPLINLEPIKTANEDAPPSDAFINNKIEKMEQLLNKYKDSLKVMKEKNSQLSDEVQKFTFELEAKIKENEELKSATSSLKEANKKIQELNETIEDLQNKNNTFEFAKSKEMSILELNLKDAQAEIVTLKKKIEVLSKREEEYAISLAENKLSIHKELESKEAEIKSLKNNLSNSQNEIQSMNILVSEYKSKLAESEKELTNWKNISSELELYKTKNNDFKTQIDSIKEKCQLLENSNNKIEEDYKCLQLQLKQETAEKLAMIDRNDYLENRNAHLVDDNSKKTSKIKILEDELELLKGDIEKVSNYDIQESNEIMRLNEEVNVWKTKCFGLESEIQEERVELDKLQSEIEKLLYNYEHVQKLNRDLNCDVEELKTQIQKLKNKVIPPDKLKRCCESVGNEVKHLRQLINKSAEEMKLLKLMAVDSLNHFNNQVILINSLSTKEQNQSTTVHNELKKINTNLENRVADISQQYNKVLEELNLINNENKNLKFQIEESFSQNSLQLHEIETVNNERNLNLCELNNMKETTVELRKTVDELTNEKVIITGKIKEVEKENLGLLQKLKSLENEHQSFRLQSEKILENLKDTENRYNKINCEYINLKKDYDEKTAYTLKLESDIETLKKDNDILRNSSETITKSLYDIEIEMDQLKLSHSKIEKEKDHLNSVIEKLEQNVEIAKVYSDQNNQTEVSGLNKIEKESNLKNDYIVKYETLSNECNLLKLENKRLLSEIEGMQIHMTKVSKENSELNNRIRELISSDDNAEKSDTEFLKLEIQSGNDKVEHLLRENNLLLEENLELKDQLQSQMSNNIHSSITKTNHSDQQKTEEYKKILDSKAKLEVKLSDLEQINNTVNKEMNQMLENNQKLRLSNEKLERRLDEALVSLRHLHSLQENTELEYLRNILYEYLTGSGSHSYTLAKVLSAVVKFDERQTDVVLQKEKERQGLLRQLGIM